MNWKLNESSHCFCHREMRLFVFVRIFFCIFWFRKLWIEYTPGNGKTVMACLVWGSLRVFGLWRSKLSTTQFYVQSCLMLCFDLPWLPNEGPNILLATLKIRSSFLIISWSQLNLFFGKSAKMSPLRGFPLSELICLLIFSAEIWIEESNFHVGA